MVEINSTKIVEQLMTFTEHQVGPAMHQVYSVYEGMVIFGAYERIVIGGLIFVLFTLFGIGLFIGAGYDQNRGAISSDEAAGMGIGGLVALCIAVVGIIIAVIGFSHLYDPPFQVIQLFIRQSKNL